MNRNSNPADLKPLLIQCAASSLLLFPGIYEHPQKRKSHIMLSLIEKPAGLLHIVKPQLTGASASSGGKAVWRFCFRTAAWFFHPPAATPMFQSSS